MQRPPNTETHKKDPLPSVILEPTESEIDAASNLITFGSPRYAALCTAPQKVPRVKQPLPRKEPRVQKLSKKPLAKDRKQSTSAPLGPATPQKNKAAAVGEIMATVGGSPQRSPVKLANGLAAYVCHSMVDQIGPTYCSADYLAMKNFPKNCATCMKKLLPGRGKAEDKKDGITRVSTKGRSKFVKMLSIIGTTCVPIACALIVTHWRMLVRVVLLERGLLILDPNLIPERDSRVGRNEILNRSLLLLATVLCCGRRIGWSLLTMTTK